MTSMGLSQTFVAILAVASPTIAGCGDSSEGKGDDAGTDSVDGTGTDATGDADGGTTGDGGGTGTGDASGGETADGGDTTSGGDSSTGDTSGGETTGGADDGFNCAIVIFCTEDCADGACVADCLANGTMEGRDEANDLLDCDEANSCDFGDQCLDDNCAPELLACFSGELDCEQVSACIDDCETICAGDQECEDICGVSCFYEGTTDAQQTYDDLVTCAESNGCTTDQCLLDNCGSQLDACFP